MGAGRKELQNRTFYWQHTPYSDLTTLTGMLWKGATHNSWKCPHKPTVHPNSCHFHSGTIPLLLHHRNYFRLPGPWRRSYLTSWPCWARTPPALRDLSEGPGTSPSVRKKDIKRMESTGGAEPAGPEMPYVLPGPGNEPLPPAGMAQIPAWALLMPARHLQHRDKELWMCSSQGKSCHQRQEGEQHRQDEKRDVPEGWGRAGTSYRRGRATKCYWTGVFKRCLEASLSWSITE